VFAYEAGVQFVRVWVTIETEENPATPSNMEGVLAGADVMFPVPEQPPVTVYDLDSAVAVNDFKPAKSGKDIVELFDPVAGELLPPPQPTRLIRNIAIAPN
jgi:hypothetical protein